MVRNVWLLNNATVPPSTLIQLTPCRCGKDFRFTLFALLCDVPVGPGTISDEGRAADGKLESKELEVVTCLDGMSPEDVVQYIQRRMNVYELDIDDERIKLIRLLPRPIGMGLFPTVLEDTVGSTTSTNNAKSLTVEDLERAFSRTEPGTTTSCTRPPCNRCVVCKAKVGTGMASVLRCKCGATLCSYHRGTSTHDCSVFGPKTWNS